jgi:hypothetical protein
LRSKPPPRASGRPRVPPSLNRNTTSRLGVGDEKVMRSIERRAQLRETRPRFARQRQRARSGLEEKRVPSGSSLHTTRSSRATSRAHREALRAETTRHARRFGYRKLFASLHTLASSRRAASSRTASIKAERKNVTTRRARAARTADREPLRTPRKSRA